MYQLPTNIVVLILFLFFTRLSLAYEDDYSCQDTICSPRAGDLLIGRDSALVASSTCGFENVDTYCVVTASGKSHCSECYSKQAYNPITSPNSHRIENVISRVPSDPYRWWQSENALSNVTLTLNLETQFQFISTILRFKTFRPAAMYLERSVDFAQTWQPYAYFSNNCPSDFPHIPERPRQTLNDVICTSIYSQLTPSEGGVVAFMAAPSEMHANLPPYSEERQNLTAITNLRVTFTRLNTLGDMQLDDSTAIRRKYYYAMYEWNVWGRCSCFGHATRCKPKSHSEIPNLEQVYGVCECTHNTAGDNCERCASFYQAKPWRPASRDTANACERCECHDHSDQCYFNPILYLQSGNISGGHCYQCRHNTEGPQCEFCSIGFYRHPDYTISHPQTCQPCNCHAGGSETHENCDQYTNAAEGKVAGRCVCKANIGGDKCDRCRVGYWNFRADNPDGCEDCKCHMLGTLDNNGCDQFTGSCTCKRFVEGEFCDRCMPGYFNLTTSPLGCEPCACSPVGSMRADCDADRGVCKCKTNFSGRDCSHVDDGYFIRPPSILIDQTVDQTEIPVEKPEKDGQYVFIVETDPRHFVEGDRWLVTVAVRQVASNCLNNPYRVEITKDTRMIILTSVCITAGQTTVVSILPESREGSPYTEVVIDNIIIKLDDIGAGNLAEYCETFRDVSGQILAGQMDPSQMPQRCQAYFNIPENHWKDKGAVAVPCECNVTGSITPICDKATGQCPCRPGVVGRTCNQCEVYHYHFSSSGCTACNCHPDGSLGMHCDPFSSQCQCRPGIEGRKCDICGRGHWNFPFCQRCECNGKADECDQGTGACLDCGENTGGPRCETCAHGYYGDPLRGVLCRPCECPGGGVDHSEGCQMHPVVGMQCHCQQGYTGPRCSECSPNYYGSPTEIGGSCEPCQCSGNLPLEGGCDQISGACLTCLHNTEGERCERCILGYWGNASLQTCQQCSCYALGTFGGADAHCNHLTGVCDCLPNVIGPRCFECAPRHFNISSGRGCETCDCDPSGSLHLECHHLSGQCTCKPERSGRKCDQCQRTYFGDPRHADGCQRCECDPTGSLNDVCDPVNGQCTCREGIAGRRCDRCDRGTTGTLPNCKPCGECWTNWNKAINDVHDEMRRLMNQTSNQLPSDLKPLYEILQALVEQLELIPGSDLTEVQLDTLNDILVLAEQKVLTMENVDGTAGKLTEILTNLGKLQEEQDAISTTVKDNEVLLKQFSTDLDEMMKASNNISLKDAYGAYTALMRAEEQGRKIEALQKSLESRRVSLDLLHQTAAREMNGRVEADEELKRLIKVITERIKDLQDEIRKLNRLMCGDNQRVAGVGADLKICPSACGGVGCDPVTAEYFDLKEYQGVSVAQPRRPLGLISGCAGDSGCSKSSQGRLKTLLLEHLAAQNRLAGVLQRSAKVDNLIGTVNASRTEAEIVLRTITEKLETLTERVGRVQNLTNSIITEAQQGLEKYRNVTQDRYEELVREILKLKHKVELKDALELGNSLERIALELGQRIERIIEQSADERQIAKTLLQRAKRIRDKAKSFLEQMNKLNDVNSIYDQLESSEVFNEMEDQQHRNTARKIKEQLDRLEAEKQVFSEDISNQGDQANQNAVISQRLVEETETARRMGQKSLQDLQMLNSSFEMLEEKLDALTEAMDRIGGANSGDGNDEEPGIQDPSELAKQVNAYIEKLEADLTEVEMIMKPLDYVEKETPELTAKLEKVVKEFKTLGSKISPNTKHQRFCS